jgi:formylglycine-generating enzyme required for sulfatase activity
MKPDRPSLLLLLLLTFAGTALAATNPPPAARTVSQADITSRECRTLRLAIEDLSQTFGARYPQGREFLRRLDAVEPRLLAGDAAAREEFVQLRREALLANPLLDAQRLLVLKRRPKDVSKLITDHDRQIGFSAGPGRDIGMPSNHECNSSLERTDYDNELCVLSPIGPRGELRTLHRPADAAYVGEVDLHWDGRRLLFTKSDATNWKVFELRADGSGLRQVSQMPDDVDSFDACYLPNGRIIFGSTAAYQSVPCWHGQKRVSNLYLMNADGSGVRQVCFDQDHDFHPTVLPNGQVLYHRWDYTGISHIYLRELMVMNPDGTGQRAVYGSGSWYPNALYFPRALPGDSGRLVSILSGYHGVHRMGQLVLLDTARGWLEAEGIVQRISGRGDPIKPMVKDNLVDADWPKFLHPFPISEKHFLVSARLNAKGHWGIYLADVFDNLVLVREEPGWALLEPVLLKATPRPPVIPDRVDLSRKDAFVYLHDVYAGPGLAGVPRGTVKSLRVIAYHFGYRGLAGPDQIGYGGPWEVMRILGTVALEDDGSAFFRVPANTPLAVQPLDAEGKAVQLMRSWFTAMPGEKLSCVGCHERPADTARPQLALAALRPPRDLTPWHDPARGFDFAREVQPVLDKHCTRCHDGQQQSPDLRATELVTNYAGRAISELGIRRLHPKMFADTHGMLRYTPAYDALIAHVRRVGIEDDVTMLTPGEYHADTSPLVQTLRQGHQDVKLDAEDWDRLVTWIDLNAPCHGTWGEVYPIPDGAHEHRMALRRQFGGPEEDPEGIPQPAVRSPEECRMPNAEKPGGTKSVHGSERAIKVLEFPADLARERTIPLGDGISLKLVLVSAGEFLTSDANSSADQPQAPRVVITEPFWMAACEISNEQYRRFDPGHDPRYYNRRHAASDDQGLPLNGPRQPVVRVSWDEAMAFCRWLSDRTGLHFTLPTEAQWEWACRAGSPTPLSCGSLEADFSPWANVADASFSKGLVKDGKQTTGGLDHLVLEGALLSDIRFNDGAVVTADVGSYRPNAWGLHDMQGNAAEWTLSAVQSPPTRDASTVADRRIVRGGSFFDNPKHCGSDGRLDYPRWQRIFNVGFRVVAEVGAEPLTVKATTPSPY